MITLWSNVEGGLKLIIEQIDDKKLMIMLEEEDMDSLNLTYDKISWKNTKFKMLIAKLLALAKFKTGFSVDNCKLSIETIPQGSGCVIIFTLFPELKVESNSLDGMVSFNSSNFEPYIYKFKNSDDLLNVCDKISRIKSSKINSSTAFKVKDDYFIVIYPKEENFPENVSVILSEYGKKIKFSRTSEAYLYESGRVIHNKNAISYIGRCVR